MENSGIAAIATAFSYSFSEKTSSKASDRVREGDKTKRDWASVTLLFYSRLAKLSWSLTCFNSEISGDTFGSRFTLLSDHTVYFSLSTFRTTANLFYPELKTKPKTENWHL